MCTQPACNCADLFLFGLLAVAISGSVAARLLPVQRFLAVKWERRDRNQKSQSEAGRQNVDGLRELLDDGAEDETHEAENSDNRARDLFGSCLALEVLQCEAVSALGTAQHIPRQLTM